MKLFKIIFVFLSLLFAGQVMAQDATVSRSATNFNVALSATDLITNTGTLSKVIGIGAKHALQLYTVQVTLDSISGTPAQAVVLAGSIDNVNYTTITTVNWAGSSADTTFVITDVSTGVAWPYMRVKCTGQNTAVAQLTKLKGRFIDKY